MVVSPRLPALVLLSLPLRGCLETLGVIAGFTETICMFMRDFSWLETV